MTNKNDDGYAVTMHPLVRSTSGRTGLSRIFGRVTEAHIAASRIGVSIRLQAAILGTVLSCLTLGFGASSAIAFNYTPHSQFGATGSQAGQFMDPQGVAVDQATHDVYVTDTGNHRVEKFSNSGTFMAAWGWGVADGAATSEVCTSGCQAGEEGKGGGEFVAPTVVAVDNSDGPSRGDVYVGDEGNDLVEKFNSAGEYIPSFAESDSDLFGGTEFGSVYGVAVDNNGDVWVYDSTSEVYEFQNNGEEIRQWATGAVAESRGGFGVNANGTVYAPLNGHLERFSPTGVELGEFDSSTTSTTGLATGLANGNIFVDEAGAVAKYDLVPTVLVSPIAALGQGVLVDGVGVGVDAVTGDVYIADSASDEVDVFGPPPAGPPTLERVLVRNVKSDSMELNMAIYTGQTDTKYRVEYGLTKSYGSVIPAAEADVGSNGEEVTVNQSLSNLEPNTLYHYRVVATNSHGTASSLDSTFMTYSSETPTLPDGRGYELVSPTEKNDGNIERDFEVLVDNASPIQAAPSGDAVAYGSTTSFSGTENARANEYLSTRGATGWSTQPLSPESNIRAVGSFQDPYESLSENLSVGVLNWAYAVLAPGATAGYENLYVHNIADDSYQLVTTTAPPDGYPSTFVGASTDYSHVVFETEYALTENAVPSTSNVYEWSDGRLSLVSIPPGSDTGAEESHGGGTGEHGSGRNTWNAVSSSGQLVFWTDGHEQLYVRENGINTVKVNASKRSPSLGDGSAVFDGATPDGERAFFSDATALTGSSNDHGGLYEFNTSDDELTNLTPDTTGSPGLLGVVGVGEEVSGNAPYVYFVAEESLANGAAVGRPNLYAAHGGQVTFIATLSQADEDDWARILTQRDAAVTPDGMHVVFMSQERLTGYDNSEDGGGMADTEVFEYDLQTGHLHCVSCNPNGEAPVGLSSVPVWSSSHYNSGYLSSDGSRVFFDSDDVLSPRDSDGTQDVYEWEQSGAGGCKVANGCIYLISAGTSASASTFYAANPSGSDVFFGTSSQLVPQDTDEAVDVYDARVNGGFPIVPALAQCAGEACLGPLSAAPEIASPPTAFLRPPSSEDTSGISSSHAATFKLAAIGTRALSRAVKTGSLTLFVTVSEGGEVWAKMATRVGHHNRVIATDAVHAVGAARVPLKLMLTKFARSSLARSHKLTAAITVGYSKATGQRHAAVTLVGSGSAR